MLTQKELKKHLHYDPETGTFTRISSSKYSQRYVGEIAGGVNDCGYVNLRINGVIHKAHRLAWLYIYGVFPNGNIDHVNGIKSDNRISKLRIATRSQNGANSKIYKNNTTGYTGVVNDKGRYRATINKDGVFHHLGSFGTPEEAARAYQDKAEELFGEFAYHKNNEEG